MSRRSAAWRVSFALALAPLAGCIYGRPINPPVRLGSQGPRAEVREEFSVAGRLVRRTEVLVYADGGEQPHGRDTRWYPDGTLRSERLYELGTEVGRAESWHPDGTPRSVHTFDPARTAVARFFHPDGTLEAEGPSLNGTRVGEWTFYHPGGEVAKRGLYADGRRAGTWTIYWESGALRSRGRYVDDRRVPPWRHWPASPPTFELPDEAQ